MALRTITTKTERFAPMTSQRCAVVCDHCGLAGPETDIDLVAVQRARSRGWVRPNDRTQEWMCPACYAAQCVSVSVSLPIRVR